ncbi:MAG: carboxypeptidase regulatory-like domain-containing protein [Acidobacteriota bacterium]|nr:carboxypeptidase regulatory-like domain-containing protein [Acidobacteriota bacterium]
MPAPLPFPTRTRCASLALALGLLGFALPTVTPAQQTTATAAASELPDAPDFAPGTLLGTVQDGDGAIVANATLELTSTTDPSQHRTALSAADGSFTFPSVPPGPLTLAVSATGFQPRQTTATLLPGQSLELDTIRLTAAAAISVQVTASPAEVAEQQVHFEEQQRVLGVIPNFYAVYDEHPAPLSTRQKYHLALRSLVDPMTFLGTGLGAGLQQATNQLRGYGQGTVGYARRYGAGLASYTTSTLLGGAVLPALFHQDPRYFYSGRGSVRQRTLYALKWSILCKSDRDRWQPNYSGLLGSAAAGALANLYYPATDREGWSVTGESTLLGIAGSAFANLMQEFVVPHMTPHRIHAS